MKERPILFSGPMVRAILEGRKTQTRRVMKPQPELSSNSIIGEFPVLNHHGAQFRRSGILDCCPYGAPGDRLWVRETWGESGYQRIEYKAHPADGKDFRCVSRWRPSIHMPRLASRITLEIEDVRVERLEEITAADAVAEGLSCLTKDGSLYKYGIADWEGKPDVKFPWQEWDKEPRAAFAKLWDSINAKRGYSWALNPWVWKITFKKCGPK